MKIWTQKIMGVRPGCGEILFDSGQDEILVGEGVCVGYVGRKPESPVQLIGHPNSELMLALADHFGIDRKITGPSVIFDERLNPVARSEEDDE